MAIISGLEKILGEQRTQKLVESKIYCGVVDGIANNVFSQVYILNEYFIAGLTFTQALQTRAAAFVGNMITGRPYGMLEDYVHQKFHIIEDGPHKSHRLKRYTASVATFAVGQSWIYALYLALPVISREIYEGIRDADFHQICRSYQQVDWRKVRTGALSLTLLAPLLARPQRWTYRKIRNQFGVEKPKPNHN